MSKKIYALLLCAVLFAGVLTGCNNNGSETNETTKKKNNGYMQTDDDFDYSKETDIFDESKKSDTDNILPSGRTTEMMNPNGGDMDKLAVYFYGQYIDAENKGFIVTFNDPRINLSGFKLEEYSMNNLWFSEDSNVTYIREYDQDLFELNMSVSDAYLTENFIDIYMESEFGRREMEENQALIADDGRWFMGASIRTKNVYTIYYELETETYNDNPYCLAFTYFQVASEDDAMTIYAQCKETIRVYNVENDYLNVKDENGNAVDLSKYSFLSDLAAKALTDTIGIVAPKAIQFIELYGRSGSIIIIPYQDSKIEYTIEYNEYDVKDKLEDSISFGGKQIDIGTGYSEKDKIFCFELGENGDGYFRIESHFPNAVSLQEHKSKFIENFR